MCLRFAHPGAWTLGYLSSSSRQWLVRVDQGSVDSPAFQPATCRPAKQHPKLSECMRTILGDLRCGLKEHGRILTASAIVSLIASCKLTDIIHVKCLIESLAHRKDLVCRAVLIRRMLLLLCLRLTACCLGPQGLSPGCSPCLVHGTHFPPPD